MDIGYYIGIPFRDHGRDLTGMDCWGLVRHFYKIEWGVDLPDFNSYEDSTDSEAISGLVAGEKSNWIPCEEPAFGDVIVFNIFGKPNHVGIWLSDQKFLHTFRKVDSCLESVKSHVWKNRVEGVYRYE